MKRIKFNTLLPAIVFLVISFGQVMTPAISFACPASGLGSGARSQILSGVGETGNNCSSSGVNTLVGNVVSLIAEVAGIIGIVMIVIAGIKFSTSGGDTSKVSSAKNSLIYALVGLVVAALAIAIVHFVLGQALSVL